MTIDLDFDSLQRTIVEQLQDYLACVPEDLKKDLLVDVERIARRSAELGARAAGGDQVARENLDDLYAQAVSMGAIVAMREQDRLAATLQLIASTVLKTLIGAAAGAL